MIMMGARRERRRYARLKASRESVVYSQNWTCVSGTFSCHPSPPAFVRAKAAVHCEVGIGMHRDQCLVVEGHSWLPVGVVFVLLQVQEWCWFGLVCPAEGLFQEPKEVRALGVRPGHGLQCGGLGRVVGHRGLVEDVDAGFSFRRCWWLGIRGRGGGSFPARALSGVKKVDDTLSRGRLAAPLLGLWQGPCVMDFACVLVAGEVLCVRGAQLYGYHLTTVLVSPEFDGLPHPLVVGGGWVLFEVYPESLVVPHDAVPIVDLTSGPYPHGGACGVAYLKGSCTRASMAYSGYRAAASSSVHGFGLGLGFGAGLARMVQRLMCMPPKVLLGSRL